LTKYFPQASLKLKTNLEKSTSLLEIEKYLGSAIKEDSQRKVMKSCLGKCFSVLSKNEVCVTLWRPVCGKDGKTYSNACFAKIAGVKIAHKGICEKKNIKIRKQKIEKLRLEKLKPEIKEMKIMNKSENR